MTPYPGLTAGPALILAAIVLLMASTVPAQPADTQPETAAPGNAPVSPAPKPIVLNVKVTGGAPPVPIAQALVLVSAMPDDGTQQRSRSTNQQGIAQFANLRTGTYRIHVSAEGWRLYGGDHQLEKSKETLEIVLTEE